MRFLRPALLAILCYLGGCFVGSMGYPQLFWTTVLWSPVVIPMYFVYADIFFGSIGALLIAILFLTACGLIIHGMRVGKRRWTTRGAYALAFSVGALGGFAVVMSHVL